MCTELDPDHAEADSNKDSYHGQLQLPNGINKKLCNWCSVCITAWNNKREYLAVMTLHQ